MSEWAGLLAARGQGVPEEAWAASKPSRRVAAPACGGRCSHACRHSRIASATGRAVLGHHAAGLQARVPPGWGQRGPAAECSGQWAGAVAVKAAQAATKGARLDRRMLWVSRRNIVCSI
jgi:hypothetical protein